MVSIAWALSKLRFPLKPELGGTSPGYIDGLNWRWTAANTLTIDSGAAWCPYDTNGRVIVLPATTVLVVPQGAGNTRIHLWLHSDTGTPTVVADVSPLQDNYFGDAYRHATNKGWRYLGSALRNSNGDLFAQSCTQNTIYFHIHIAQAPFEFINTTGQLAARSIDLSPLLPASAFTIKFNVTSVNGPARFAASPATAAGNSPSNGWFTYATASNVLTDLEVGLGRDYTMQYSNDVAGGVVVARCHGYRFRR